MQSKLIIFSILAFTLLAVLKSAWFKGWLGELKINIGARLLLNSNKYLLLKNVTLPTKDGSTQIDHIIVSYYGIFVIETKNMKGWIFGSSTQKQWTQQIFRHKSRFQNPLHQNYKHRKTLEGLLGLPRDTIKSVIAFVGSAEFKTPMPENVCYGWKCFQHIKAFKKIIYTQTEILQIKEQIENFRRPNNLITHFEHVAHVKDIIREKEAPLKTDAQPYCTRCDSEMRLRTTKKGANAGRQFWGCSTYPHCRHTIQQSN